MAVSQYSLEKTDLSRGYPTGISFIDQMTEGGFAPGEAIGFIAPSGGGKTTIVNQLGVEMAKLGRRFAIFQYEQSLDGRYFSSLYACATGIDRIKFSGSGHDIMSRLTDGEKKLVKAAEDTLAGRLFYFDMSGSGLTGSSRGGGGPMEIDSILSDLERKGIYLDGFAIDWYLPMASRMYSGTSQKRDERRFYQDIVDQLKRIAGRHKVFAWVNNQLAPAKAGQRHRVSWDDSAEFKSFAWLLDVCFSMTSLDDYGHGILYAGKNRNAPKVTKAIALNGKIGRFCPVEDHLEWSTSLRKYVKSEGEVPVSEEIVKEGEPGRVNGV